MLSRCLGRTFIRPNVGRITATSVTSYRFKAAPAKKIENLETKEKLHYQWGIFTNWFSESIFNFLLQAVVAVGVIWGLFRCMKMIFVEDQRAAMTDMTGQMVVITGASSGFGKNLAYECAARNATVLMCSRSKKNLSCAKRNILKDFPDANVKMLHLNLADFSTVQKCAKRIIELKEELGLKLDVVVNNAGIFKPAGARDPYMSEDGIERSFQVNFLGHYLLTELLKDHLLQDNGRLISVLCDSGRKGVLSIDPNDKNSACKDIKVHSTRLDSSPAAVEKQKDLTIDQEKSFKHVESYMQAKLCLSN